MLYQELVRVNELDSQISNLHHLLNNLYAERADLLTKWPPNAAVTSEQTTAIAAPRQAADEQAEYQKLAEAWKRYAVKLPDYRSFKKKLTRAGEVRQELIRQNPQLEAKISLVAVPPLKTLKELAASAKTPDGLVFNFSAVEVNLPKTKNPAWSLLLVLDGQFDQQILSITDYINSSDFKYGEHDCRALGLAGLLAAELQGVAVTSENNWTLLLEGSDGTEPVVCATRRRGEIVMELDDTNGLLGSNCLRPAIKVG